jgi:TPR repeat protein
MSSLAKIFNVLKKQGQKVRRQFKGNIQYLALDRSCNAPSPLAYITPRLYCAPAYPCSAAFLYQYTACLDAQNNLGAMYVNGKGASKDDKQAVYWYQKAAAQENTGAQYNLGVMYTNGKGVSKDAKQAVYWYQKAAEQGYAGAQYNLLSLFF